MQLSQIIDNPFHFISITRKTNKFPLCGTTPQEQNPAIEQSGGGETKKGNGMRIRRDENTPWLE